MNKGGAKVQLNSFLNDRIYPPATPPPGKKPPLCTEQQARQAPKLIQMSSRRDKLLDPTHKQSPDHPGRKIITVSTQPFRPLHYKHSLCNLSWLVQRSAIISAHTIMLESLTFCQLKQSIWSLNRCKACQRKNTENFINYSTLITHRIRTANLEN